eukprot:2477307-Amphidinium_carterae.2
MAITSHSPVRQPRSVRRLTLSHRFSVALHRSAICTPQDPSGNLEDFQDEFMSATTHEDITHKISHKAEDRVNTPKG